MPDDINTPAEEAQVPVAEQDSDLQREQEIEAGFADIDGTDGAESAPGSGEADTIKAGVETKEEPEAKDESVDAGEPDPLAQLQAKAEAREKAAGEAAPGEKPPAQAPAPAQDGPAGEKPRMTKEVVNNYLEFFKDVVPEGKFIIGDKELNFEDMETDMPGVSDAIRLGSGLAAAKYVDHLAKQGQIITAKAMDKVMSEVVQPMQSELEEMRFWLQVASRDAEALPLIHSKELKDWLAKQPGPVQRMAKSLDTPQDALEFVNAYRNDLAKQKVSEHDKKARKGLDRQQALHGHSASPGRRSPARDEASAAAEEEAGFASV